MKYLYYGFVLSVLGCCFQVFAQGSGTTAGATSAGSTTSATQQGRCNPGEIELNTEIPFVTEPGRPCISKDLDESAQQTNVSNAFPRLMASLARILMTVILVGAFMAILVGGLMMASAGFSGKYEEGKSLIIKVIGALALIGISGAILNAVNPNFFKTDSKIETIKYKV